MAKSERLGHRIYSAFESYLIDKVGQPKDLLGTISDRKALREVFKDKVGEQLQRMPRAEGEAPKLLEFRIEGIQMTGGKSMGCSFSLKGTIDPDGTDASLAEQSRGALDWAVGNAPKVTPITVSCTVSP